MDLGAKSCTCRRWGLRGIPCPYVIASITQRGLDIYDFVHPSPLKSSYGHVHSHYVYSSLSKSCYGFVRSSLLTSCYWQVYSHYV